MTHDQKTDTDDLVERLDDSKGWPNLGKAAAARIRADEQALKEANEVIKAAEELVKNAKSNTPEGQKWRVDGADIVQLDEALAAFRQAHGRAEKGGE